MTKFKPSQIRTYDNINITKGNPSFQLKKLSEANYIQIKKSYKGSSAYNL